MLQVFGLHEVYQTVSNVIKELHEKEDSQAASSRDALKRSTTTEDPACPTSAPFPCMTSLGEG